MCGVMAIAQTARPPALLYHFIVNLVLCDVFFLLSSLYLLFILLLQRVMIHGRAAEQSGDEVMDRW